MATHYDSNLYTTTTTVYNNAQSESVIPPLALNPGLRNIKLKIPTLSGLGINLSEWTQRKTGSGQSIQYHPQWCKFVSPENKFDFKSVPFSLLGVYPNTSSTGAVIGMGFTQPKIWVSSAAKNNYFSSDPDIVGGDSSLEASSTAFGSYKKTRGSSPYRRIIPTGYQFCIVEGSSQTSKGLVRLEDATYFTGDLFENYYPVLNNTWEPNTDNPSEGYNYPNFLEKDSSNSIDFAAGPFQRGIFCLTNYNNNNYSTNKRCFGIMNIDTDTSGFCDTLIGAGISGETTRMAAVGARAGESSYVRYRPILIPCQDPDTLAFSNNIINSYKVSPGSEAALDSPHWDYGGSGGTLGISPFTFVYDDENDNWYLLSLNFFLTTTKEKVCYLELQLISISNGNYKCYLTKMFNLQEPEPEPGPGDYDDEDIEPGVGDGEDPYEDIDNSNEPASVGGDHDLEDHITDVDDTPNTSYESFIAATNYFGSYKLSLQNLQNYADTLKVLYDHSTDVFGSAYSAYANRITEGTTSLIMLPYSTWKTAADAEGPADYTHGEFAIGGAGIKASGASFTEYVLGSTGAFDNADLMNTYTKRWTVQLDPIIRKFDNFLDYAPYSKASIFIPYVGQFELPINLIQSAKNDAHKIGLRVKFGLNISNGDVIAIFEAEIKNSENNWTYTPLGTWTGNCARSIRLSVSDDSQAIREGVRALTSMVSFAASGGAAGAVMGQSSQGVSNSRKGMDPTQTTQTWGDMDTASNSSSHGSSVSFSGNASSAMPNAISPGQHLIGGASTAGELGWLGIQKIVVKVERPIWWMPGRYANLFGYPTKRYATLRNLSGFATVSRIHLRCSATGPEKEEIERLLSEGVIFGGT